MRKADRNALLALPVVVLIGAGVAVAGSQGGSTAFGIPAYLLQNEGFFDITGSVT